MMVIAVADKTLEKVYADIEVDNVRLRSKFVASEPLLTGADFKRLTANGSIQVGQLEEWLASRAIFSIAHDGQLLVPAFQLHDNHPRPVIARVLEQLSRMTDWQIAFWFVSSNPALDGLPPILVLDDEEAILAAAAEVDGYVG